MTHCSACPFTFWCSTKRGPPARQIQALPVPLPLGGEQRLGVRAHGGQEAVPCRGTVFTVTCANTDWLLTWNLRDSCSKWHCREDKRGVVGEDFPWLILYPLSHAYMYLTVLWACTGSGPRAGTLNRIMRWYTMYWSCVTTVRPGLCPDIRWFQIRCCLWGRGLLIQLTAFVHRGR